MYVHLITFIGSLNIIYILIESRPNMCLGDTGNTLIGRAGGGRSYQTIVLRLAIRNLLNCSFIINVHLLKYDLLNFQIGSIIDTPRHLPLVTTSNTTTASFHVIFLLLNRVCRQFLSYPLNPNIRNTLRRKVYLDVLQRAVLCLWQQEIKEQPAKHSHSAVEKDNAWHAQRLFKVKVRFGRSEDHYVTQCRHYARCTGTRPANERTCTCKQRYIFVDAASCGWIHTCMERPR